MEREGVLAYWFNLAPEIQREWADWYIRDHMPSRLGATFTGARCLQATSGNGKFMALYTTETPEALISPSYLSLLQNVSDDDRRRRGWYTDTVRGCCRKLEDVGYGHGGIVGSVRFSLREKSALGNIGEFVKSVASIAPIGRVTYLSADSAIRAKLDAARITGLTDGAADLILLVEGPTEEDVDAAVDRALAMPLWTGSVDPATVKRETYRVLYSIAK